MPTLEHEGLVALFENRPELAAELLASAGVHPLPDFTETAVQSASLSQLDPVAFRADAVVLFKKDDRPSLAIIVEVQRGIDRDKPFTWTSYAAAVFHRHRCPVCVLVVTPDRAVARWASEPIEALVDAPWRPVVIGPDEIPVFDDVEDAPPSPEQAILSVFAHGRSSDTERAAKTGLAAVHACRGLPPDLQALYFHMIDRGLEVLAARRMEALLAATGEQQVGYFEAKELKAREEGLEKGREKGREEGQRQNQIANLLQVLQLRFGPLPVQMVAQLRAADMPELERAFTAALTAKQLDEVFPTFGQG